MKEKCSNIKICAKISDAEWSPPTLHLVGPTIEKKEKKKVILCLFPSFMSYILYRPI